jgi:peptidoglycan/xylan/chitin deacetylase (PgdA/CDA1 family)
MLSRKPPFLARQLAARFPNVLFHAEISVRAVALTIDDAPHDAVTPKILDALRSHGARATFFLLGRRLPGRERIVERMRTEGHELGNHLVDDRPSILLSPSEFERQLLEVDGKIRSTGAAAKWFRPGSGWFNSRMVDVLGRHGYRCCLGSIYPHDTKLRIVRAIAGHIQRALFPGGIIILHDGAPDRIRTVKVLHRVLPRMADLGYRVVTVSELLNLQG